MFFFFCFFFKWEAAAQMYKPAIRPEPVESENWKRRWSPTDPRSYSQLHPHFHVEHTQWGSPHAADSTCYSHPQRHLWVWSHHRVSSQRRWSLGVGQSCGVVPKYGIRANFKREENERFSVCFDIQVNIFNVLWKKKVGKKCNKCIQNVMCVVVLMLKKISDTVATATNQQLI